MATGHEKDLESSQTETIDTSSPPRREMGMKADAIELETIEEPGVYDDKLYLSPPEKEARRILRKVDWRLIPVLTFLYLVAFIDRSNSEYQSIKSIKDNNSHSK
jgi:hypothetical protein